MRIRQLPPAIANQIAAGEVIERPASIVKEVLENALDAGADVITIEVYAGGLSLIRVSDNGSGIIADDLPLAIAPHATSKLSSLHELHCIESMGFRGEALASIASVSQFSISSKVADALHAMKLIATEGQFYMEPCARTQGTTVEVRDLFYNVPVRKRFLKSVQLEFQAIEVVVRRFALSATHINIQLLHNDKSRLKVAATHDEKARIVRIKQIFGKRFVDNALFFNEEQGGMRLYGWLANRSYQRSQNDRQWIYVNSRMVKDKLLNHAVRQAYDSFLEPGRHPACLLHFFIDPAQVDVNVHPTKHEVRFEDPRAVHDFILSILYQRLTVEKKLVLPQSSGTAFDARKSSYKLALTEDLAYSEKWISLDDSFCIILLQNKALLVDVKHLYLEWLNEQLSESQLPLANRSLVVPIQYRYNGDNCSLSFASHIQLLQTMGLYVDEIGEKTVVLRTLPTLMPHLHVKLFLDAFFAADPTVESLRHCLIDCQLFNPEMATEEEKNTLREFLFTFVQHDKTQQKWYRWLSSTYCKALLYD